jgi:hypothetical protein
MRLFSALPSAGVARLSLALILIFGLSPDSIAMDIKQAADQVKNLPCKDGKTVDEILNHSVKRRSQRDLGWRTFEEEGHYDIERAVLITKGMELRYRWRVLNDGQINAESSRAQKLCDQDEE